MKAAPATAADWGGGEVGFRNRLSPSSKRGQASGASIAATHRNTQATEAAIPPASPAQVFDGLILGAILGPPIARPAK